MKYLLISLLFLIGCDNNIRKDFPAIPPSLESSCDNLELINENTEKLSTILTVVTSNYSKYHECKLKVDTWLNWYNEQKKYFFIQ